MTNRTKQRLRNAVPNSDGTSAQVKCERCREGFTARIADIKRGWGRFCSKRCKAIKQTYGADAFRSER